MYGQFDNIKLSGVATAVPSTIVENISSNVAMDEKNIRKQINATGIERKRYVKDNQTAVDLCVCAAQKLMSSLEWNPQEVKVILYVSSYTLFAIPSTAFLIQHKLGVGNDCTVFDVNLACSGFVVGMETIGSLLQHCSEGAKALLFVGVTPSKGADMCDYSTCSLFGDAGAVAAFEVKKGYHTYFSNNSDGGRYQLLFKEFEKPMQMDGLGVFHFTISEVADSINAFLDYYALDRKDISACFLHQAQKFILDKLIDFCQLEEKKCYMSYKDYGNTGAVSIPLTMALYNTFFDSVGKKNIFMSGYGAGLSWANMWMEVEDVVVLPIICSDDTICM